jgi:hypothetical protein
MSKSNFLTISLDGMISKSLMLLVGLMLVSAFLLKNAHALDVDCQIPNSIVCEVSDPDGFMSVRVNVDFGDLGMIDVVNHTFPKCVTSATVSWDPIVPNFQVFTTKCQSGLASMELGRQKTRDSAPLVRARSLEIEADGFGRPLSVKALKPVIKPLGSGHLTGRESVQYIYKEECEWTNDNVAQCMVWDCDAEDVCVELGEYCVDHNAHTIPCP